MRWNALLHGKPVPLDYWASRCHLVEYQRLVPFLLFPILRNLRLGQRRCKSSYLASTRSLVFYANYS